MKRFGTEREINLDDDDIEFIVQQVPCLCVRVARRILSVVVVVPASAIVSCL